MTAEAFQGPKVLFAKMSSLQRLFSWKRAPVRPVCVRWDRSRRWHAWPLRSRQDRGSRSPRPPPREHGYQPVTTPTRRHSPAPGGQSKGQVQFPPSPMDWEVSVLVPRSEGSRGWGAGGWGPEVLSVGVGPRMRSLSWAEGMGERTVSWRSGNTDRTACAKGLWSAGGCTGPQGEATAAGSGTLWACPEDCTAVVVPPHPSLQASCT